MSHDATDSKLFGIAAEYETAEELIKVAKRVKEEGYSDFDAYSPIPVHGLYEAMGGKRSILAWLVLCGGILGCLGGFYLQYWISVEAYPLNVGGKPMFSWPSFVPVTFECTVLLAGLTALFAMLGLNGLPMPHHPIFNTPNFERASNDRFFICIEATDPKFDEAAVKQLLQSSGAVQVSEVES